MDIIHIMPLNEEGNHEQKEGCRCKPSQAMKGAGYKILIHNSITENKYCEIVKQPGEWKKTKFLTA